MDNVSSLSGSRCIEEFSTGRGPSGCAPAPMDTSDTSDASDIPTGREPRPPSSNHPQSSTVNHGSCCGYCHNPAGPFQHCARCKVKLYCSRDCQKKDWPDHRIVCTQTNDQLMARVDTMTDKIARNKFFAHVVSTLALYWLPEGHPIVVIREFTNGRFVATGKPLSPDMSTIIAGMFIRHSSGPAHSNVGSSISREALEEMAAGQTINHATGYVCDMFLYATGDTIDNRQASDSNINSHVIPVAECASEGQTRGLSDMSAATDAPIGDLKATCRTVIAHAPKDPQIHQSNDKLDEKLSANSTSDHYAAIIRYVVSATIAHDSYIVISKKEAHESRASYGSWFNPDHFTGHLRLFMSGNLIALDSNVTDLDIGLSDPQPTEKVSGLSDASGLGESGNTS